MTQPGLALHLFYLASRVISYKVWGGLVFSVRTVCICTTFCEDMRLQCVGVISGILFKTCIDKMQDKDRRMDGAGA